MQRYKGLGFRPTGVEGSQIRKGLKATRPFSLGKARGEPRNICRSRGDRRDLMPKFLEWEGHYTHVGVGEALHLNSRYKVHPITLFLFPSILWLKNVAKICYNIEKIVELKIYKKEKFLNYLPNFFPKKDQICPKKKDR
jgi:hypothetical protein